MTISARNGDRRAVLLPAVDAVREPVVHVDPVELRRRLRVLRAPALARVEGDGCAAVVRDDEVAGIVGVDPQVVEVAVRARQGLPGLQK